MGHQYTFLIYTYMYIDICLHFSATYEYPYAWRMFFVSYKQLIIWHVEWAQLFSIWINPLDKINLYIFLIIWVKYQQDVL